MHHSGASSSYVNETKHLNNIFGLIQKLSTLNYCRDVTGLCGQNETEKETHLCSVWSFIADIPLVSNLKCVST